MGSRAFDHLPGRDRAVVRALLRALTARTHSPSSWREGETVTLFGFLFDRHTAPEGRDEWRARFALEVNAQYVCLGSDHPLADARDGHAVIEGEVVRVGTESRPALIRVKHVVAMTGRAD